MKERSPFLWLLLIPGGVIGGILLTVLGVVLDSAIFAGGTHGHGIPLFVALFFVLGTLAALVCCVIALVMTFRRICCRKRNREKK